MSEPADDACVDKLRVLADPTRLAVLGALLVAPRHVGELAELLAVEQSSMSHHLRTLRDAGLVFGERDGKAMRYQLSPGVRAGKAGLDLGCCKLSFDSKARDPEARNG